MGSTFSGREFLARVALCATFYPINVALMWILLPISGHDKIEMAAATPYVVGCLGPLSMALESAVFVGLDLAFRKRRNHTLVAYLLALVSSTAVLSAWVLSQKS